MSGSSQFEMDLEELLELLHGEEGRVAWRGSVA